MIFFSFKIEFILFASDFFFFPLMLRGNPSFKGFSFSGKFSFFFSQCPKKKGKKKKKAPTQQSSAIS
jgi:hypothetical protein